MSCQSCCCCCLHCCSCCCCCRLGFRGRHRRMGRRHLCMPTSINNKLHGQCAGARLQLASLEASCAGASQQVRLGAHRAATTHTEHRHRQYKVTNTDHGKHRLGWMKAYQCPADSNAALAAHLALHAAIWVPLECMCNGLW